MGQNLLQDSPGVWVRGRGWAVGAQTTKRVNVISNHGTEAPKEEHCSSVHTAPQRGLCLTSRTREDSPPYRER